MKEFIFNYFYLVFFLVCLVITAVFEFARHKQSLTRSQALCYSLGIAPFFVGFFLGYYAFCEILEIESFPDYLVTGFIFFFPYLILLLVSVVLLVFWANKKHEKKLISLFLITFACGYALYYFLWIGVGFGAGW